jgi:isopenicillin N synthase-like dioxygenase
MASPSVPIIDVAPFLASDPDGMRAVVRQVGRACETIGFLVITGHGISPDLQHRTLQVCQEFFDLPDVEKMRYHDAFGTYQGYNPLGLERVAYSRGEETPPDLKACFTLTRLERDERDPYYSSELGKQYFPPLIWPDRPAQFRSILTEYNRALAQLAGKIMEMFALALDLPQKYFADKTDKSIDFFRAIEYPPLSEPPLPGQFRVGPHTDYGTLTLVLADGPGLQVQTPAGEWEDVPYLPGSLQVNIGDMMAQWTNDLWTSTMHRVVPLDSLVTMRRRMALPFFQTPNYDVVVEPLPTCCSLDRPPRYAPVIAGEQMFAKVNRQFTPEGEAIVDIRQRSLQRSLARES